MPWLRTKASLVLVFSVFSWIVSGFLPLNLQNAGGLSIFIILLWMTELVPLAVTALMVPVLSLLFGLTTPAKAFLPFGNQILFLFIGAFLLAGAMQKHGWDKRIAYYILSVRWFSASTIRVIFSLGAITFALSMWISNTSVTALMIPLGLSVATVVVPQLEKESDKRSFLLRLLISTAFCASVGGLATPVGTAPNMLAIEFLKEKGISISFLEWMKYGFPIAVISYFLVQFVVGARYPVPKVNLLCLQKEFNDQLQRLGKVKKSEVITFICFLIALVLWVCPEVLTQIFPDSSFFLLLKERIPMGSAAMIAVIPLFLLHDEKGSAVLNWQDAAKIDWGTIMLFGGGLCLGAVIESSGLAGFLAQTLIEEGRGSFLLIGFFAILLAIVLSEFGSNTATTAILIPILLGIAHNYSADDSILLVLAGTFGASFGFMLPVSTPPNAILYGTGRVPLKDMIYTGVFLDVLGLVVLFVFLFFVL